MKYLPRHFPSLVRSTWREFQAEAIEQEHVATKERPPEPRDVVKVGMAVYLEPDIVWTCDPRSPWAHVPTDVTSIGARASVVFLGGTRADAQKMARDIVAESGRLGKTRPVVFRRLSPEYQADRGEMSATTEDFDGFLVPTYASHDMALAFERTRRRVIRLVECAIESGWTKAPFITMESPSPEFSERISEGLCEYLVVKDAPVGARFTPDKIIATAEKGRAPWWITSGNYLYCIQGTHLWYEEWMIAP